MKRKSIKIYIAGKLETENEREKLKELDKICKEMGFNTFLPHRDVGLCKDINDIDKIFKGDVINGFKDCGLIIVLLDGLHVGAGSAWELGYAYAKGIPAIGLKTDEPVEEAIEYLSAILVGSMPIVKTIDDLKKELIKRFG